LHPKFSRRLTYLRKKLNFYFSCGVTDDLLRVFVLRALPAHEQLFCGGEIYF